MFGPRRPQKTYAHYKINCFLQGQTSVGGAAAPSALTPPSVESDPASNGNTVEGSPPRRNLLAPRLGHRRRGLLREPGRADGSTGRSVASASCPPRTSARLVASATRPRRRSRQWTARPGSGRRSFFSSHLCLCSCWHRCLRLQLIAERPKVPLTKQEQPRAARPTEPRDSYASGIRIPHSSPSHEATHTWLSGSASRQASPSARNEDETRLHAKNTYMFRPRQPQ
jgi:hypothetical protein